MDREKALALVRSIIGTFVEQNDQSLSDEQRSELGDVTTSIEGLINEIIDDKNYDERRKTGETGE